MKSGTVCACRETHDDALKTAKQAELGVNSLLRLADLFKLMADPTRLRILQALASTELCVCDLCAVLDMNQSAISHQLALLRRGLLVRFRKEGKTVFYSLDDDHVNSLLALGLEHVHEERKLS